MTRKYENGIRALLTAGDLGPDYIEQLLRRFEHERDVAPRDTAEEFGKAVRFDDYETAEVELHSFLEATAAHMPRVLAERMWRDDKAAMLFLWGHKQGFWPASDDLLARARRSADVEPPLGAKANYLRLKIAVLVSAYDKAQLIKARWATAPASAIARLDELVTAAKTIANDPNASSFERVLILRDWCAYMIADGKEDALCDEFDALERENPF
jgi:hypothetical protein